MPISPVRAVAVAKICYALFLELEGLKEADKLDAEAAKKPVILAFDQLLRIYGLDLIPAEMVESLIDLSNFDISKVKLPDLGGDK
jgi:hypothetical protein